MVCLLSYLLLWEERVGVLKKLSLRSSPRLCPNLGDGKGQTVRVILQQETHSVFPGRGTSVAQNTQRWESWKAALAVACGHDLWLPPDGRQPFPGKFTGSLSQTELSIWFPEVTIPQLGMQDFPLASCLCLCHAESGGRPWQRLPGATAKLYSSGFVHWRGNDNVLPQKSIYRDCY